MQKDRRLRPIIAGVLVAGLLAGLSVLSLSNLAGLNYGQASYLAALALIGSLVARSSRARAGSPLGLMFAMPAVIGGHLAEALVLAVLAGLGAFALSRPGLWPSLRQLSGWTVVLGLAALLEQELAARGAEALAIAATVLIVGAFVITVLWGWATGTALKRALTTPAPRSQAWFATLTMVFGAFAALALADSAGYVLIPGLLLYSLAERRQSISRAQMEQALTHTIEMAASSLDARDGYTEAHSKRVGALAAEIGRRLRLDPQYCRELERAGILHDLGKVALPDRILNKPGKLSYEEWKQVTSHPALGADLLLQHAELEHLAPVVRAHHERLDGSGYPDGLKAEQIPLAARILAVAEVFDALTNPTPWRRSALAPEEAVWQIAKRSHHWYDPRVIDALRQIYPGLVDRGQSSAKVSIPQPPAPQPADPPAAN